ncbi:MAG TPA: formate dehydrogenase accessory sulfurtransferase FdhD [Roseiflexaceae bacterium]|nr:formate dehydrogenase accessory sulfurtransferase FdhD [Roseiflexaceae bacterium]
MDQSPIDAIVDLDYIEYDAGQVQAVRRPVIVEAPWVLYLDRRELLTMMCTPVRLHCLALGFLLSEGIIGGLEDLWQLRVFTDEDRLFLLFPEAGICEERHQHTCAEAVGSIDVRLRRPAPPRPERRILTSGCGGGLTFDDLSAGRAPLRSELRLPAAQICALMRDMQQHAGLYSQSRGVHTSALYDPQNAARLALAEDVGRHNTLDKIRGECLLAGIDTRDRVLVTSGRISTEMIGKAHRMGVPIVVSRTSPTVTSVRLAQSWNITLVGYVRSQRLRVYSCPERIGPE